MTAYNSPDPAIEVLSDTEKIRRALEKLTQAVFEIANCGSVPNEIGAKVNEQIREIRGLLKP